MIFWSLFLYHLLSAEDGRLYLAKTGKEVHLLRTKWRQGIGDKGSSKGVGGRDYQQSPGLCQLFGGCGKMSSGCEGGVSCRAGRRGQCGRNGHCDRAQRVCMCNSYKQDYPNCCFPSCKIDGTCVNGACRCISSGVYPNCEEVCGQGCRKGKICKMVGRRAKCVCRQRFVSKGGVCTPCENSKNELETTVKQTTITETPAGTTDQYETPTFEKGEITTPSITGKVTGTSITGRPTTHKSITGRNKTPKLEKENTTLRRTTQLKGITVKVTGNGISGRPTTENKPKADEEEIIKQEGKHIFQKGEVTENEIAERQTTNKSVTEPEETTQLKGIIGKVTGRPLPEDTPSSNHQTPKRRGDGVTENVTLGSREVIPDRGEIIPEKGEVIPGREEVIPEKGEVIPEKGEVIPERPTTAISRRRFCEGKRQGPMVQKDIDSEEGWIKLECAGGCIQVYKVRYNCCFNGLDPIPKDLEIANGLCKDKERCEIRDLEETFGHPGCEGERRMWLWYSCNGGKDRTTSIKKNVCHFI